MSSGPKGRATYDNHAVPSNYVAGLGRGAVGFTTRSDIGPARDAPDMPQFGQTPGPPPSAAAAAAANREKEEFSETQFDEFSGYGGALFRDTPYEEDDAEADRVYEAIDERMDERRKRRREQQLLENMKKFRQERPKISDQFADLKRELASVPQEDWEKIPDVGDHSLKIKQKKKADMYSAVPDAILAGAHAAAAAAPSASAASGLATPLGMATPFSRAAGGLMTPLGPGGFATPAGGPASGTLTDSGALAQARGTVLSLKLDKMSDSVTGQTVVDPKGYLTDLNSIKISSEAEVGDIKKARLLLKSVTTTNPKHAPGWIAAARVEVLAGKIVQARNVIKQGCEICPESEDVWLEAARLQTPDNAKTILANAVRHLPTSVEIWLKAAELETDRDKRKVVLRRALEFVPNAVKLWKTAIELEDAADARIMLGRAVECVPHSVDMWLALTRLETYENARRVLNRARAAIPTEPAIWITAAKLEEAHGNHHQVDKIIENAIKFLTRDQVVIDREQWLKEAEAAEAASAPLTCAAIVRTTIYRGVEDDDRKRTWLDDAASCLARNSIETARAIYAFALTVFPQKKSIWRAACDLERKHGTPESHEQMLRKAVTHCPKAEILWLMAAKEKWLRGDVPAAREILTEAFAANPDSEEIWLAAAKLEWANDEFERARQLLYKACERAPSEKVWMKLALLERECGRTKEQLQVLDEAVRHFPDFAKYYMMAGQACEAQSEAPRAKAYYQAGIKRCPQSVPLWRLAAELERSGAGVVKARSMLELARLRNPKSDELWLQAVRLEKLAGNEKLATNLMAKALQDCPDAGILWAEEIRTAPRPERRAKSLEALKRNDNNPFVIAAVAGLFVDERKYPKARKWYNRAVKIDESIGDVWAQYYAFELAHGEEEQQRDVLNRCVAAEPKYGELWCSVSKDPQNRKMEKRDVLLEVSRIVEAKARGEEAPRRGAGGAVGAAAAAATARVKMEEDDVVGAKNPPPAAGGGR
eukprot:CAMPEP_0118989306 /NCGR_PEP_ID=MMETSP1173-20130426/47770_1 /TAXON_ID=1034831 /ORGANISM="Rhizochromulina marina cf, Strain CCMP1243" /LENGTH=993 /DNA_ID=CAMNT_0006940291 /DNA_START=51 /DNA_END=3035 /DNA_ORIENTATION=-